VAYRVLGRKENIFQGYGARVGLEGPFIMGSNRVLYYDAQQGQYWDPRTDFYLEPDEIALLDAQMLAMLTC